MANWSEEFVAAILNQDMRTKSTKSEVKWSEFKEIFLKLKIA